MTTSNGHARSRVRDLSILLALGAGAWQCPASTTTTTTSGPPSCGDAITQVGEQCDDGNAVAGDGCDACVIEPGCRNDLGEASPYDVFSLDFLRDTPDVEGTAAARGAVELQGFSIGFVAPGNPALVGGSLDLSKGEIWGDTFYATSLNQSNVTLRGGGKYVLGSPFSWADAEVHVKALSAWLATQPSNGTTNVLDFGVILLNLVGTDPELNVFTVQASDLDQTVAFELFVPTTSYAVINVVGGSASLSDFTLQLHGLDPSHVLFNFSEATSIDMARISWEGTVLAPYAALQFDNGQLNGQAIVASAQGTGEFHHVLYTGGFACKVECGNGIVEDGEQCDDGNLKAGDGCDPDCTVSPPKDCPEDLGAAELYNVFVYDAFSGSPDVEGKLAAGGAVGLEGFAVGFADRGGDALIGGDITLDRGTVYGNVVHSGGLSMSLVDLAEGGAAIPGSPIDFTAARADHLALSSYLAALPSNGSRTITPIGGGVLVDLQGTDPVLNVFEVAGSDLSAARSLTISTPPGATVVVNVTGASVDPSDFDFFYSGTSASKVLYNLYKATEVDLTRIGWKGTLLAPLADVTFGNGQMDGQLIANSATGDGEYHFVLFDGTLCP